MSNKILVLEPFSGSTAGAQKVTLNIMSMLESKRDVFLIKRNASKDYDLILNDFNVAGFFPLEKILSKVYGSGDFFYNLTMFKLLMFFVTVVTCNIYVLFKAIKIRPSYIYTYDPRGLVLGCLLLRLFGFKVIWHLHSEIPKKRTIKTIVLLLCTRVIVPSTAVSKCLSSRKVAVIYNGFHFAPTNEVINITQQETPETFKLIFLGTPHPHKGIHNLIQALLLIEKINPSINIELSVYGSFEECNSNYRLYFEDYIEKLKINKVYFQGWTNKVSDKLFESDILVFPSVLEQRLSLGGEEINVRSSEALPTVLIESLSLGVPVIASNTPGVSEIIQCPEDGIIIAESEPLLIANAINKMVKKFNFYTPNIEMTREKFSFSAMESEIFNVFI